MQYGLSFYKANNNTGISNDPTNIISSPKPKQFFPDYSKTCVKRPLKNRQNKDVNEKWYLNEG